MRIVTAVLVGMLAAGCAAARPGISYQSRSLGTDDYDLAFQAAGRAAREYFQVRWQDRAQGVIRTFPQQAVGKLGPHTNRRISEALVPRRENIRRTAYLHLRRTPGGIFADCRVKLERLDTQIHESQRGERVFNDIPTDTPIDRGAGATPEQQRLWTDAGRDRPMEGKLLTSVRQHVQSLIEAGEGKAPATKPAE